MIAVYAQDKNNIQRKENGIFEALRSPIKKWFYKGPTKDDLQKITTALAENVDEKMNDIYRLATNKEPNYNDVFDWLVHGAHEPSNSKVTEELIRVAIERGDTTAAKYSGLVASGTSTYSPPAPKNSGKKLDGSQEIGSP